MQTHPCGMLVRLERNVQHLASLVAVLVHQLVADGQKTREVGLDDLVELRPALAVGSFEPVGTADGEQTLQTSLYRWGIIGVEKLYCVVHKGRPSLGEIEVEDSLEDRYELLPHKSRRSGEDGQKPILESCLRILGNHHLLGVVLLSLPCAVDTVLEIDDS